MDRSFLLGLTYTSALPTNEEEAYMAHTQFKADLHTPTGEEGIVRTVGELRGILMTPKITVFVYVDSLESYIKVRKRDIHEWVARIYQSNNTLKIDRSHTGPCWKYDSNILTIWIDPWHM